VTNEIKGRAAVILLVEDDPGDQELTKRAFKNGKIKNDLRVVNDGEEALDYLHRRGKFADRKSSPRPDLVLLDLNMPKVDGKQVLAEMRSDPDLRTIPVVVLTTSQQESDVLRSYDLGANSYITKPVQASEFTRTLSSLENYWLEVVVLPPRAAPAHR
jgi:CheY-like chemotaxis protein